MIYCFDTSAINRLHDDPDRDSIVTGLVTTNTCCVSDLNGAEIRNAPDVNRQASLRDLLNELQPRDLGLLEHPIDLLKRLAKYVEDGESEHFAVTAGYRNDLVAKPALIDKGLTQKLSELHSDYEVGFRELFRQLRPQLQSHLDSGSVGRPRSLAAWVRGSCLDNKLRDKFCSIIYEDITGNKVSRDGLSRLVRLAPEWSVHFVGWAHEYYRRVIQEANYSPSKQAGFTDLWYGVYLPVFEDECFVTADGPQYRALRFLNAFNPRKTKMLSYEAFRRRLVLN